MGDLEYKPGGEGFRSNVVLSPSGVGINREIGRFNRGTGLCVNLELLEGVEGREEAVEA